MLRILLHELKYTVVLIGLLYAFLAAATIAVFLTFPEGNEERYEFIVMLIVICTAAYVLIARNIVRLRFFTVLPVPLSHIGAVITLTPVLFIVGEFLLAGIITMVLFQSYVTGFMLRLAIILFSASLLINAMHLIQVDMITFVRGRITRLLFLVISNVILIPIMLAVVFTVSGRDEAEPTMLRVGWIYDLGRFIFSDLGLLTLFVLAVGLTWLQFITFARRKSFVDSEVCVSPLIAALESRDGEKQ